MDLRRKRKSLPRREHYCKDQDLIQWPRIIQESCHAMFMDEEQKV